MTKPWADGPFKLIETPNKARKLKGLKQTNASEAATQMALVHNSFIRALNSIYLQAENIDVNNKQDIEDFLGYISSWSYAIHAHHESEEEVAFPLLDEEIGIENYMEPNKEQHEAFGPGFKEFDAYIQDIKDGKEPYDGAKIKEVLDKFASILVNHLVEEVVFMEGLERYEDKVNWVKYRKAVGDHAVKSANTEFEVPLMMTNMDLTFEKGVHEKYWPPWPWVGGLIFRWFYIPKHQGYWRFASCDPKSQPQELPFA